MAFRVPSCRALDTASWASKNVIFDGVLLAEGGVAALLGLCGLRFVPMMLLAAGWKLGEYVVKACAPMSLAPAQATLRPALADLAVLLGAWTAGRLVRWMIQRRKRDDLGRGLSLSVDIDPPGWQSSQWDGAQPKRLAEAERSWTTPGAIVLELEDREADSLRSAIEGRLEDLRRVADRPSPHGVRDEIWQTIATLESLLARLPAAHMYDRSARWSQSGNRL